MDHRSTAQLPGQSPSPAPETAQQAKGKTAEALGSSAAGSPAAGQVRITQSGNGRAQHGSKQQWPTTDAQLQRLTSPNRRRPSETPPGLLTPQLSQDMEGFFVPEAGVPGADGPDPLFAGHELYRALRGSQGDDPLTDELLWDGDFLTSQREFIQKQQEQQMLERLERRMGRVKAAPREGQAADADISVDPAAPSLAAIANVAKTGAKFMGLIGKLMPKGQAPGGSADAASPGAAAGGVSVENAAGAPPTASRPGSPAKAVSAPTSPAKVALLDATSPTAIATASIAEPAVTTLQDALALQAASQQHKSSASGAASNQATPRLLTRLVTSLKSPRGARLGNLVAEDDGKQQAAEVKPPANAAADGTVEVAALAVRKEATEASQEKAKQAEEHLQRMDTAGKLELAAQKEQSWIRRTAIKICTHSDFELLVLILIFGNCISLATYDPVHHDSDRNQILENVDIALNAAFTVEMILRILSLGGILRYLSHPWNAFDCVMVLAGYTTFIPVSGTSGSGLEGLKALRALRAMRPLRTITRFPALRSIVVCFLEAVPLLVSVAAMLFFFLFIFAVAGTELFGDSFHYGCIEPTTGTREDDFVSVADEFGCGDRQCPAAFPVCNVFVDSQSREIAGFDNVGYSMLSVFQAMTLSNWSFTMYRTMDYLSPALVIYWFVLIIFGSYFVLNLFLAVLKTKFAKAKNLLDEKRRHRRAMKGARDSKKQNILMRTGGWLKGKVSTYVSSKAGKDSLSSHVSDVLAKRAASRSQDLNFTSRTDLTGFTENLGPASRVTSEANMTAAAAGAAWAAGSQSGAHSIRFADGAVSGGAAAGGSYGSMHSNSGGVHSNSGRGHNNIAVLNNSGGFHSNSAGTHSSSTVHSNSGGVHSNCEGPAQRTVRMEPAQSNLAAGVGNAAGKQALERQLSRSTSIGSGYSGHSAYTGVTGVTGTSGFSTGSYSHECLLAIEEFDETVQEMPYYKRWPMMLQYRMRVLVCNSWFNNIFLLAIVLNTVALAMTYEGMSDGLEEGLHQANFIFTFLFTAEMVLKMAGLGPWRYLTDPWSLFDAAVVAFSLVEVVTELQARSSSNGGLTALRSVRSLRVLRSFRVLRVMKMFKYLESLKMIASVLISSMGSFASIVVLLVLFWMVFSIMGLHVFGGLPLDEPWPNCNDLINSLILNFNTLNLENFQTQMYSVIRATSYASSAFWLVWVIIGKYILLTLFLAVTLDAFERKYEVDMKKGVRSQSLASTVFSRIKKAGARIKGAVSTQAGNSSVKSGLLGSLWGPDSLKASGHHSVKMGQIGLGVESEVVHDAIAAFHGGGDSGSGSGTQHRRSSADDHSQGSRGRRRSSTDGERYSSASSGHDRHGGPSEQHGGQGERRKSMDRRTIAADSRRRTGEGVRFAQGPAQPHHKGPVGEEACQSELIVTGWDVGIRQRRHMLGLQLQYGQSLSSSRRVSTDSRRVSAENSSSDAPATAVALQAPGSVPGAGSMQRRRFLNVQRTSSSNGSSTSTTSSMKFRIDTAAAFAAAAAAESLQPIHAFPEFVDSSTDEEDRDSKISKRQANQQQDEARNYDDALAEALHAARSQHNMSSSDRGNRSKDSGTVATAKEEDPFTWHEFLSTINAIDYPSKVHEQQQAAGASSFRASGTAATLGPIAEGVESDNDSSARMPKYRPASRSAATNRDAGAAPPPQDVTAVAAAVIVGHVMSPRPPAAPKPATANRSRAPQQQLALKGIDRESATLGIPEDQEDPSTPAFLVHGTDSGSYPAAEADTRGPSTGLSAGRLQQRTGVRSANSVWPGLDDDNVSNPADAAAEGSAGMRPTSGSAADSRPQNTPHIDSTDSRDSGSVPAKARRVTLFTESMRIRNEGPQAPNSPRHSYNPDRLPTHGSASNLRAGAAVSMSELDDLVEAAGHACGSAPRGTEDGYARSPSTGFDAALLLDGAVASVEPSITAKAIRRRKAAAGVSFATDAAGNAAVGLPGGADDAGAAAGGMLSSRPSDAASSQNAVQAVAAENSVPNAGSNSRRLSRQMSQGSEANYSDGHSSYHSGNQSGNWSTISRSRTRSYPELTGRSLWLFSDSNPFRAKLYDVVTNKYFDYCMFFVILLNCVAMAYEYPHMSNDSMDGLVLYWADIAFTIVFSLEALMKIIAFGFKPYMSYFQNQVDLLIVVTSLIMAFLDSMDLEIVKALRVLRAIKPLRALTRSAGMQLIFKSLTLSLAAMGNVSIVVLLFFMIFAILGVQLFHGKFFYCTDDSVPDSGSCVGTFLLDGVEAPREWKNQPYNFDNIGMALVSLFVTATLNGYTDIMAAAMAAPEDPGLQPQPMSNWSSFFYFAAFVLVVAYTLLNLYIGVVFYQFSRIRLQSQTGSAFLTDDQTEWVELSRLVFRLKPPEKSPVPVNKFRKKLYYLVQSKRFEFAIMIVIIANSALMATSFYGQPELMKEVVEAMNYAFTGVYVVELLMKVGGLGWPNYWKNNWNKFDLLLVMSSVVDMAVALALGSHASFLKVQKIMRLLRLARVVKLMRSMKGLRSLFGTLIVSLPAFWNVGALLALLFYMYAYVGMLLLGNIKRNGGLNEHTNFERFWTAALTLFKIATNDNWTDIMIACMVSPPDCDPDAGECGSWVVYPYFISFVLIVSVIMLNLFTAVILESFEAQQEQDRWKLRPDHLDEFVDLWAEYDDGTGTIDPKDLEAMLLRLSPPLGLGSTASSTDVLRFVFDLDIPLLAGRVPFQRTAYELVRRCSGAEIPEGILKDQIDRLVTRAFKNLKADEVLNFSVAVTVMRVQRKWRARMRAAKLKRKREFRAERGVAPAYADVLASRDTVMKNAVQRRQSGDLRWRPNAAYAQQWAHAEAVVAAEEAAAAAALHSSNSFRRSSSGGDSADGHRWTSLANLRETADGWMHRVTGGVQRFTLGRFFASARDQIGAISGRSSLWGFGSRASSKGFSAVTSAAASETAGSRMSDAVSRVASETASRAASEMASQGVPSAAASMMLSGVGSEGTAEAGDLVMQASRANSSRIMGRTGSGQQPGILRTSKKE